MVKYYHYYHYYIYSAFVNNGLFILGFKQLFSPLSLAEIGVNQQCQCSFWGHRHKKWLRRSPLCTKTYWLLHRDQDPAGEGISQWLNCYFGCIQLIKRESNQAVAWDATEVGCNAVWHCRGGSRVSLPWRSHRTIPVPVTPLVSQHSGEVFVLSAAFPDLQPEFRVGNGKKDWVRRRGGGNCPELRGTGHYWNIDVKKDLWTCESSLLWTLAQHQYLLFSCSYWFNMW